MKNSQDVYKRQGVVIMKKHFRLTLFKKVFLSIFCMILGIEIFHANQSYMSEVNYQKELLYLQIGKTMPDVITTNKLHEKYSNVYDKNFLNEFQKKTEILSEYNCMILDKDCLLYTSIQRHLTLEVDVLKTEDYQKASSWVDIVISILWP